MTATVVTSENLAEFQATGVVPSAPAPAEAVEKTEPASEPIESEGNTPDTEDDAKQQDEAKPVNPKVEKRFSELTKQREDARRDAAREREAREATEQRLKELEAKLNPPKAVETDAKPTPGQFTDAFEYAEALAEWSAENAMRNRDKAEADKKAASEREKVVSEWTKRMSATKAEIADYDEALADSSVSVSDPVRDAILESDIGPKILYHLAKNPDVAEALASKSIPSALRAIGRLEAELSGNKTAASPAGKPSRAPEPISPIRATKAVDSPIDSKGEFHGTYADWKAARAAGKIR